MEILLFIVVIILVSFTVFLVQRQKLINKLKREMNDMAKYASDYRNKLLEEGALEDYKGRSREELQNELSNLQYRLDNLRYPEDKEAILEADQRRSLIEEVLESR